jgi:hypothetical protein
MGLVFLLAGTGAFVAVFNFLPVAAQQAVETATSQTLKGLSSDLERLKTAINNPELTQLAASVNQWKGAAFDESKLVAIASQLEAIRLKIESHSSTIQVHADAIAKTDIPSLAQAATAPAEVAAAVKAMNDALSARTSGHKNSLAILSECQDIAMDAITALGVACIDQSRWENSGNYALKDWERKLLSATIDPVADGVASDTSAREMRSALESSSDWRRGNVGSRVASALHEIRDKRTEVIEKVVSLRRQLGKVRKDAETTGQLDFGSPSTQFTDLANSLTKLDSQAKTLEKSADLLISATRGFHIPPPPAPKDGETPAAPDPDIPGTSTSQLKQATAQLGALLQGNEQLQKLTAQVAGLASLIDETKTQLDTASAGVRGIINVPDTVQKIAFQVHGPISYLALAMSALLMATGLASMIRWARLGEERRANESWNQKAEVAKSLIAAIPQKSHGPILSFLAAIDTSKDSGKGVHTPLTLALSELIESLAAQKKAGP